MKNSSVKNFRFVAHSSNDFEGAESFCLPPQNQPFVVLLEISGRGCKATLIIKQSKIFELQSNSCN